MVPGWLGLFLSWGCDMGARESLPRVTEVCLNYCTTVSPPGPVAKDLQSSRLPL